MSMSGKKFGSLCVRKSQCHSNSHRGRAVDVVAARSSLARHGGTQQLGASSPTHRRRNSTHRRCKSGPRSGLGCRPQIANLNPAAATSAMAATPMLAAMRRDGFWFKRFWNSGHVKRSCQHLAQPRKLCSTPPNARNASCPCSTIHVTPASHGVPGSVSAALSAHPCVQNHGLNQLLEGAIALPVLLLAAAAAAAPDGHLRRDIGNALDALARGWVDCLDAL
eukprot:366466-Chlamydomonas_euryale.AAC.15